MSLSLESLVGQPWLGKLASVALFAILMLVVARLVRGAVSRRVTDNAVSHRLRKYTGFAAAALIALYVASTYSDRLSGISVALGVAGAGVAFALQEVIASVAGWFAVAFGRFYATGDRVQLGGIKGDVIDIGVLRTTLMEVGEWIKGDLYNGRIVRVANSFVFKEPVFNYSADFPFVWDEIVLPVRYGSDWNFATRMFQQILEDECGDYARQSADSWKRARKRYLLEDARIDPLVTISANDNWINVTGRYIVDYRQRRTTADRLYRRILAAVDDSGGRVRLASTTIEISHLPRIDIGGGPGNAAGASRPPS